MVYILLAEGFEEMEEAPTLVEEPPFALTEELNENPKKKKRR